MKLRSYFGHEIPVIGEAKVQVQEVVLPVVITGNDDSVLIGRDWLSVLKLDWGRIKQVFLEPFNKLDLFKRSIRRCLMVIWEPLKELLHI